MPIEITSNLIGNRYFKETVLILMTDLILMSTHTTRSTTIARPPLRIHGIFFEAEQVKWLGTNSTIQHLADERKPII